jgi:hypothetical protein
MENFLVIQGDPSKIGQDGSNKISEKHKELRKEVLDKIQVLQEKIKEVLLSQY